MKKHITLQIPNPCQVKWENLSPTSMGKSCSTCQTSVLDFTKMDSKQLIYYFQVNANKRTCGRFSLAQLRLINSSKSSIRISLPRMQTFRIGLTSLLIAAIGTAASAQFVPSQLVNTYPTSKEDKTVVLDFETSSFTISGIVKTDDGEFLPGANIYLKDTNIGTTSDRNGRFVFPRKLEAGSVITFSFMGMETVEYVVPEKNVDNVEITMVYIDSIILGEVAFDEPSLKNGKKGFWKRLMAKF